MKVDAYEILIYNTDEDELTKSRVISERRYNAYRA